MAVGLRTEGTATNFDLQAPGQEMHSCKDLVLPFVCEATRGTWAVFTRCVAVGRQVARKFEQCDAEGFLLRAGATDPVASDVPVPAAAPADAADSPEPIAAVAEGGGAAAGREAATDSVDGVASGEQPSDGAALHERDDEELAVDAVAGGAGAAGDAGLEPQEAFAGGAVAHSAAPAAEGAEGGPGNAVAALSVAVAEFQGCAAGDEDEALVAELELDRHESKAETADDTADHAHSEYGAISSTGVARGSHPWVLALHCCLLLEPIPGVGDGASTGECTRTPPLDPAMLPFGFWWCCNVIATAPR
jgi:hypothetical protein